MLVAQFLGQILEKSDIFPQSLFSTKSENHLKKSNENISRSDHIQWLNSYPWTNVSVVCTFIDWVAFCHDIQKANICYRKKKGKCWTYTVNRESIQTTVDVMSVIGIFWLQQAFNIHSLIQCCLQLLSVYIDVLCANKSISLNVLVSLFFPLREMKKYCALVSD